MLLSHYCSKHLQQPGVAAFYHLEPEGGKRESANLSNKYVLNKTPTGSSQSSDYTYEVVVYYYNFILSIPTETDE